MFPEDERAAGDARVNLLIKLLQDTVGAVKVLTEINHDLVKAKGNTTDPAQLPADHPRPKHVYTPHLRELRTWAGFVKHLRRYENIVRRENHLSPTDEVSREMIYAQGGPHPKTVTRCMTERYGLTLDDWPPSTWPEESPADNF